MSSRIYTVTVELKEPVDTSASFAVRAETGPQARNMVMNRHKVQYTKETRPYHPAQDATLPRIGW